MKQFIVTISGPDKWEPTEKQMTIFINAGISNAAANGASIYRYMLKVEEIKDKGSK